MWLEHTPRPSFQLSLSASRPWGTRSRASRAWSDRGENTARGGGPPASPTSSYRGGSLAPISEGLQPLLWDGGWELGIPLRWVGWYRGCARV